MTAMGFCGGCGRSIDSAFLYCPWCGESRIKSSDDSSMEIKANAVKDNQIREQNEKMEEMEKQLDDLERELSVLVLSAEMAR